MCSKKFGRFFISTTNGPKLRPTLQRFKLFIKIFRVADMDGKCLRLNRPRVMILVIQLIPSIDNCFAGIRNLSHGISIHKAINFRIKLSRRKRLNKIAKISNSSIILRIAVR